VLRAYAACNLLVPCTNPAASKNAAGVWFLNGMPGHNQALPIPELQVIF
jgi:hypothetical protein